ncbi:DNA helicase/exodeoxyribonuclease V, beta subunit [Pseudoxanthomonas sp. GM95]|uniref:exodeoxyribonuclease V subunit beta n=1 Tax=Pseudoxanthomonas sp. GM95 TaxID=1881043 RepID=UPI0008AB1CEA|nr:exodeoxyribonuclease V subunit beta [Pseudoxanthomonas sp. GM95]SEM21960.1 DNA helicase/exodeoxyribonuclease V, beta subunit [Pseudoxanthomonas sp. GM95]
MSSVDPYLTLPLTGTRLIEASAGTGKTFTLATLVTRLVVEQRLRIGQILAVTFTEAATQELRKRIRERLILAATVVPVAPVGAASAAMGLAGDVADGSAPQDQPDLEESSSLKQLPQEQAPPDEAPDLALSRAIIAAHLDATGESAQSVQRRLQQAADEIDLAAIFTIHGFCARVLREHALESGQTFAPPELLASDRELRDELAADLWRVHAAEPGDAQALLGLWKEGPQALSRDLSKLFAPPRLLPAPTPRDAGDDPEAALHTAARALAETFAAHGETFLADLLAAVEAKVLHGGSYKASWLQPLWMELHHWCAAQRWSAPLSPRLAALTADALQAKTSVKHAGRTPTSPLCEVIALYLTALADVQVAREAERVRLLHRIRDDARTRLALLKQQRRVQTYDDLIDGVANALEGPHATALVQRLRAQYAIALVDEFQDTDPRQWSIFHTVFGDAEVTRALALPPALFLIGDPKQAIYGFRGGDVQTYLAAASLAEPAPPLDRNFRSRPSVLSAIEALYTQAGEGAFIEAGIHFHHVAPGTQRVDADYLRDGAPAPALTLWQAPAPPLDDKGKQKPWSAGDSRTLATAACVQAIHAVLTDARAGRALRNGKPIQPGDIAVLVRKHGEATRIQQALAAVGIPAVAAGKQSLFATPEAHELLTLLLALLHTADDGRLRAALATVLLGVDASGIAALEADGDAHRAWQLQALDWRERVQRGGPLALVSDLCAAQAERLLGLLDGERRLTNYLQLGELLQHAQARALGLHGLVDWLGQQINEADSDDEAQLLRLESDARRVQIVTLHKSKGLEYPLVFLPFVGIGGKAPDPGNACVVQDAARTRVLHWKLQPDTSGWTAARAQWIDAQRAEDARLLYVGLTRAEHALWIATGHFYNAKQTALASMVEDLDTLAAQPGIVVEAGAMPTQPAWLSPEAEAAPSQARSVARTLSHDWWVYSFTQLANADSGAESAASTTTLAAAGGNDEPAGEADADAPQPTEVFDPRFAGNRFGVVMHDALERSDFALWRHWQAGDAAPPAEVPVIESALRAGGYAADELEDGLTVLTTLIGQTLTVALPEGVRLCDVPEQDRRPEIEFQFALQPTAVEALLRLLHAHGVVRERHSFGLRRELEGLMTGLIDLTYCHNGRWYVLDYKSNRLPAYDGAALQRAMAHSEYDLQALIYTLALHRWLRFRLPDYDYARDFGGIRYLFCRGLDATREASPGVHAQAFAPELIDALDALFAGHTAEAA